MALLFMDGFDAGDYGIKYNAYSTSRVAGSATTRFSAGRSLAISKDIAGFGMVRKYLSATSEIYVGFSVTQTGLAANMLRLYGDNSATLHIVLNIQLNGTVEVLRNTTSLATTAPGLVSFNQWNYFEVKATIHSSTGSVVVRLNGQQIINFTGNTKNGGTASSIDCIELARGGNDGTNTYDDLYIADNTGPAPYNTFLGEIRMHTLAPNAAGSSTQFTSSSGANYTAVDETPVSATDYVSSGTAGHRDTYQLTDLPAGAGNVLAVQTATVAKKTDAAPINLKPALYSGGAVYYGSDMPLLGTDRVILDLRTTDPATSAAWTSSGVNSLEAGFEVV